MAQVDALRTELAMVAALADEYEGKGITEQDTKNALIEPVLAALGWPKTDLALVRAEYRHTSKDNPVDYALFAKGQPVLFVEAKALDQSIDRHKVVAQVIAYASVSGVNWALITNGRCWDLYAVFASVPAAQKRLFAVRVDDDRALDWLTWIAPARLAGNELDTMWRQRFAEREIRQLLKRMIAQRDTDLVDLVARRAGLRVHDVTAGFHHLRVRFEEPEPGPLLVSVTPPNPPTHRPPSPVPNPGPESGGTSVPAPPKRHRRQTVARLPRPEPGQKPRLLRVGDRSWPVRSWRDIQVVLCEYAAEVHPERYGAAFTAPELAGRKRRYLATTKEAMHSAKAVPGGFVEVNLSADNTITLAERLLDFCGVDPGTVSYETR